MGYTNLTQGLDEQRIYTDRIRTKRQNLLKQFFWQYYEDTLFWIISMNLHSVSSKEGVQILTCFQMNKSGPLQVISKLVTSDGLLMHLS